MKRRMTSAYMGKKVFVRKPTKQDENAASMVGHVRMAVFSPDGKKLVGFLVKRPDVAGMIKREDIFVLRQGVSLVEDVVLIGDLKDDAGVAAIERLGVDWDTCIMWSGMDARTTDGKVLGFVCDVAFDLQSGHVIAFCVGDGSMAQSLVGHIEIPSGMLVGYSNGYMLVEPAAAKLMLSGGIAAKAGEGYAKAKVAGAKAAKKADDAASRAINKGSKALGKQIGRTKGMFGAFMDEYKKASK